MIETTTPKNAFIERFEKLASEGAATPAWLADARKSAMARFDELGFPTTRHEEWGFTNVAPVARTTFAAAPLASIDKNALREHLFEAAATLVFVNGRFAEDLSSAGELVDGVTVSPLAEILAEDVSPAREHLSKHVDVQDYPFAALNTALFADGAFVHVDKNVAIESPIHLLFVATDSDESFAIHPRVLIVAENSSQITVVETHAGLGNNVYFSNPLTEIVAADNAFVDHYKIGRESVEAFHIGTLQIHQFRDSDVRSHAVTFGGQLVRNNISTVLDGTGGHCALNGLSMVSGSQHVDNHLRVDHAQPHCDSREYFKGILDGESHGVFTGKIIVRKDAQKTDGKQTNQNLLLSEHALADSKPQLEIFADDVKCTHGATIGQIDADAIFYLQSRGISSETARSLLVYAFAGESLENIQIEPLKTKMESLVLDRLPESHVL